MGGLLIEHHDNDHIKRETHRVIGAREFSASSIIGQSHPCIMKVFERVIKKKILSHLVENKMFNKGQHGFVPGRSTQTQLLSHYTGI